MKNAFILLNNSNNNNNKVHVGSNLARSSSKKNSLNDIELLTRAIHLFTLQRAHNIIKMLFELCKRSLYFSFVEGPLSCVIVVYENIATTVYGRSSYSFQANDAEFSVACCMSLYAIVN